MNGSQANQKREATQARSQMLKQLRETHKESADRAQELLKAQKAVRQKLCQPMRDTPKTIPELAEATGIPAPEILWHITAMKKYGLIEETGMCGEYYLYQKREEKKR